MAQIFFLAVILSDEGEAYERALEKYKSICEEEKQRVIEAGGLYILGTERHESRRIDNQLRGRAGRQGDRGCSRFFLSMEDDLMRLFGSDKIQFLMDKLGWEEGEPLEDSMITYSIESAQRRVESHHFEMRKQILKYDDVMNQQRTVIYQERRKALEDEHIHEDIEGIIEDVLDSIIRMFINPEIHPDEYDYEGLAEHINNIYSIGCVGGKITKNGPLPEPGQLCTYAKDELREELLKRINAKLNEKRRAIGDEGFFQLEKYLLLQVVDAKWKDHLHNMDTLQDGIHLRSWGQRDPLVEYKLEGFQMFENMIEGIKEDVLFYLFRVTYSQNEEREMREQKEQEMYFNHEEGEERPKSPTRANDTIDRNAPCPCGSGKKYKKCCGR